MRHIISPLDLSVDELNDVLDLAGRIYRDPKRYSKVCDGMKLATLFYEPSTRTRLSFEAAMMNLGGNVLGFSSANSSSAAKGESVLIQSVPFPVLQISVRCVTQKKVQPW